MNRTFLTVGMALVCGLSFLGGIFFSARAPHSASALVGLSGISAVPPEGVDFSPVWKAWRLLEDKYVPATTTDELTQEERMWGMIEGLAASYGDPYTVFMPPAESAQFEEDISGEFGGVGMEVGMRDGILTIIAPLKDTPAEQAGLRAGDRIIEIDGKSTEGVTVDEAVQKIRGEIGTSVTLTIAREGAGTLMEIEVERDVIKIPTIDYKLRDDGIFVISLYNFGATAGLEFRRALREFIVSGSDDLIIDLRGNPGGYLEVAVDIASWFLPAGKVVVREDFGDGREEVVHRSKGYNVAGPEWNIIILTNQGSASASEIVAGALQAHGVAALVGERTFGKGSVQELVDVTPDTSLKVTIARWLTPEGKSISEGGLEPDVAVPVTEEDIVAGRDPQMNAAVEELLKQRQ